MALTQTVTLSLPGYSGELIAVNAYAAIVGIAGGKDLLTIQVATFDGPDRSIQIGTASYRFTPALEGDNFIKQAYKHLKALPEFADAVDC